MDGKVKQEFIRYVGKEMNSSVEKLKIVLEGLSGTIQISDLCKKYGIKSARYYYWKEELINASIGIF